MLFPLLELPEARQTILRRRPWSQTEYPPALLERLAALFGERVTPEAAVARILADVQARGDAALREWSQRLDGIAPTVWHYPPEAQHEALARLPADLRAALQQAADRIAAFHRRQPTHSWLHTDPHEGVLGQLVRPLDAVGV
jgi:histidinol dehydrogenase